MPVYVDSNAAGANDGTSWADAYTSIASTTSVAAGTEIWVAHNHSQTTGAAISLNWSNGTRLSPVKILCVNSGTDALAAGAVIQTGAASNYNLTLAGWTFQHGIAWGYSDDLTVDGRFESCTFTAGATSVFSRRQIGSGIRYFEAINCTFNWSSHTGTNTEFLEATGDNSLVRLVNCTFTPNANSTEFMEVAGGDGITLIVSDCDLTSFSILLGDLNGEGTVVTFERCKIPASPTYLAGTVSGLSRFVLESCDDGTISVTPLGLTRWQTQFGVATALLTKYRTGGADDGENANAYSWEMVSNTNALEVFSPLASPPMAIWVDPDTSPSGATAEGLFQSTRMAPRGTPTALTTDSSSTWNGTGVGTKQQIDVTIGDYTLTVYVASGTTLNNDDFWVEVSAPDQIGGPVIVRAFLAKPSTTVYVDPKLVVA